ncbi:MAG: tetratricopeptide repeat protein [Nitrospirota bacterium]
MIRIAETMKRSLLVTILLSILISNVSVSGNDKNLTDIEISGEGNPRYDRFNQYDDAKRELEKNLDDNPLRRCSYDELNLYREAIEAYRQSTGVKPDFAEAYVNLGVAYCTIGKYPDAIDAYKQAIQIKSDYAPAYNKIGAAYIISGEYSLAIDSFKKAIDLEPDNASAHFNIAIAYLFKGETIAAFDEYIRLKELDKELAKTLLDLIY